MANLGSTTAVAAVLEVAGGSLTIRELVVDAPGPREVVVRTAAAGLCHSDLTFLRGQRAHDLPFVPGHEGSGVVEQVGSAVTDVEVGDHVVVCAAAECGLCRTCRRGRPWLCVGRDALWGAERRSPRLSIDGRKVHQFRGLSTFAENMLVHERAVTPIDRQLPLEVAALLGCAVATGAGSVVHQDIRKEDTVAVIGCGGVGLNVVRAAALAGATVAAVDVHPSKLALADAFGATLTVDATAVDPVAAIRAWLPGGVDHAFEVVGSARTLCQAVEMLGVGGAAYLVGIPPDGVTAALPLTDLVPGRSVRGLYLGSVRPREDIPRFARWWSDGLLDLDVLVSHRVTLADVDEAYRDLSVGEVARSLVVFPGN